jgi:predicted SAM-dependent methyltransferase
MANSPSPLLKKWRLLNLGCGSCYHPAWLNVDFRSTAPGVMACNLSHGLPFADNSFDVIYHSHLLEHFPKRYAPIFLHECFRVLKPGGIIRVVVPDLEQMARLYLDLLEKALQGDEEAQKRYDWIMLEMFDQMVRNEPGGEMLNYWEQNPMPAESFVIERCGSEVLNALAVVRNQSNSAHTAESKVGPSLDEELDARQIGQFRLSGEVHQWMYDRHSLGVLLRDVGFQNIQVCRADKSDIPNFNSYLLDIEADGSVRKPDSLFMEAQK